MIRINLLPTKAARKKETVIQQLVVGVIVLVIGLAACWYVDGQKSKEIQNEKDKINKLQAQINQLQTIIKKVEDFKKKSRELHKKISTIRNLNEQRSGPVKMLEEFTYVLPRKAWVSVFRETNKQLTLEGVAVDGPTVADFIENLRGSKYFHNVQLIQVQQVDQKGKKMQRFNINCRVNYVPGGKA